ncbi:amidohydrolase family protein [Streptomyces kunmingensis]|uniref:Amidohydrolase family protein n=1 Tax=Streptomyces kunmingensis TaxID=68225 RepID=A0ABU6CJN5_9ACTN|nr:amidohydrolase family protein [Streptomyces kunmingensis]MEB3964446.1 amidohydrolase family protein [Streptomyces kunmingensis]
MTTTTVTDAAVFDGTDLLDGRYDVTFEGALITRVAPADQAATAPVGEHVDGSGATLLPGLIDAHVHFSSPQQLVELARWGVTTALDMGTWPPAFVQELRAAAAGCDLRSSGAPLAGPAGTHSRMPAFPRENLVSTADQARSRVAAQVEEGIDHLKLIFERPGEGGLERETARAAVQAAHASGLRVVAHAGNTGAVALASAAGVDVLTHAPLDAALDEDAVRAIVDAGRVVVPTLTMMRGAAAHLAVPGLSYDNACAAVGALHRAGAVLVAGTDANDAPGVHASVPYGSSLHDELGLLVEAGLRPTEALRAATGTAAVAFGLGDRGAVRPGLRADLLLVEGTPTTDIDATRAIRRVWITGGGVDAADHTAPEATR